MLTNAVAENDHAHSNVMLLFNHGFACLATRLYGTQVHNMADGAQPGSL